MKRIGIVLGTFLATLVVVLCAAILFVNNTYYFYPAFPISNVSASYVVEKLENSQEKVAMIGEVDDYFWYLTQINEDEGFDSADKNIEQFFASEGWNFKEKIGSTLFFVQEEENLVVSTQMWTENYVLVQVENKFKAS